MVANNHKLYILMFFWIKHNLVRPNHEGKRGCVVLVEHISVVLVSLYSLGRIVLDLVLERVDTICRLQIRR